MRKFVVSCLTEQEWYTLLLWAQQRGYEWNGGGDPLIKGAEFWGEERFRNIAFGHPYAAKNRIIRVSTDRLHLSEGGPNVSFEAFAAIQGIELGPEPMTLRLSDKYEAVIDYTAKTVTVGCQVIPFTKINEVYACTKKHESKDTAPSLTYQQAENLVRNAFANVCSSGNWHAVIIEAVKGYGGLGFIHKIAENLHKNLHA